MKIPPRNLDRASVIVIVATGVELLSCLIVPEWLIRADHRGITFWKGVTLAVILVVTLLGPLIYSVVSIITCLAGSVPKTTRLVRIITAYVANLLSFAALYYALTLIGDFTDAQRKYSYYAEYEASNAKFKALYQCDMPAAVGTQSFHGMTDRLFSGVDWEAGEHSSTRRWADPPIAFQVARAKAPRDEVIRFLPDARIPVFADCLHFSVVTVATVGYGDITPASWPARAAVDCQIILGMSLLVIVVGMFFSGWWEK
jgi:hypothetical protein